MKKILATTAIATFLLSSAAVAQETDTQMNDTMGTTQTETGTVGTMDAAPDGAMTTGTVAPAADAAGSYTIITKSLAENAGNNRGVEGNRNTDPAAIQRTIDANPGLAEKLQAEGVMMDDIGSISVGPNGEVTVYSRG